MPALLRVTVASLLLATAPALAADSNCKTDYPCYSAAQIKNMASDISEPLAPYTWAILYGTKLSFNARSRSSDDDLAGFGGVHVSVNNQPARISYISPTEVHFLVPSSITAKQASVQLTREGAAGPEVTVDLVDASPAVFLMDATTVVAAHADWTLVTEEAPAHPGEIIIFYGAGLGPLKEPLKDAQVPALHPNPLARRSEFKVLLDADPVEDKLVEYAGAAPLFIGIYQINLRLPADVGRDPELRIAVGNQLSAVGFHLLVR